MRDAGGQNSNALCKATCSAEVKLDLSMRRMPCVSAAPPAVQGSAQSSGGTLYVQMRHRWHVSMASESMSSLWR